MARVQHVSKGHHLMVHGSEGNEMYVVVDGELEISVPRAGGPVSLQIARRGDTLGEVTLLYFEPQSGAEPVIGKLQGILKDLRGREVSLTADPAKVHVFLEAQSLLYRDQPVSRIATRAH